VPMIVMSFDASETKSLITVSVAVVLFGFVLGAVARARTENVFWRRLLMQLFWWYLWELVGRVAGRV
jgi:hypothetical protein